MRAGEISREADSKLYNGPDMNFTNKKKAYVFLNVRSGPKLYVQDAVECCAKQTIVGHSNHLSGTEHIIIEPLVK